ncbi:ATP-binding cassette domain-containing protein, partial [Campylobacter coli]|nr:ATP-binding cassette domain-containing protein [Campylobacter coli]
MLFFEISNLNYAYNNETILKNINLSYDSKDFLSIIGPNGAGKST